MKTAKKKWETFHLKYYTLRYFLQVYKQSQPGLNLFSVCVFLTF